MDKGNIVKILTIVVGIVISILVLVVGFNLVQNVFTRASDVEPRDVTVIDKTENSVRITWTTGIDTEGVVQYGVSPTALTSFQPETDKTTSHSVTLSLLSSNTTYYFQITSGGKTYDNGGVPWTFTTLEKAQQPVVTSPTVAPTQPVPQPTQGATQEEGCPEVEQKNCQKVKEKFGKGCNARDYVLCLDKLTGTPTP
ncbi:fibronectin type III domain-containing protein [Candidatus Roizmanbacteria bacterium]|nr:fibronectin type III domain-containing protein [Candidatus Roizmanbacteria bacterium]